MPELPEVETVRRELSPVMEGTRFTHVSLRREGLRRPFPPGFAARLTGQTLRTLNRRGKYLLGDLSSGDTLLMHLGMSGSFRVLHDDDGSMSASLHDHVLFSMSSGAIVIFNDPRRFGVVDLITPLELSRHPALAAMGPEPLSRAFDGAALARACAGRRTPLKVALLDQEVVAGLGNIYASEALHRAGLSPRRAAASIATRSGLPKESAERLARTIKQVLKDAIARKAAPYRAARFRVYDRAGEACRTPGCPGRVRRFSQAGRSTFHCPLCQR